MFLSTSNSLNSVTRTNILTGRIATLARDIALLNVLNQSLVNSIDVKNVKDYISVFERDSIELEQFKNNFNSSFYSTDPSSAFMTKIEPVKKLLDLWEYEMFYLVARKKILLMRFQTLRMS